MTELEKKWLNDFCKPTVGSRSEASLCTICGREGDDFRKALFPGYLGKNYEEHRILFVAAIHNEPVLEATASMKRLAGIAFDWADGSVECDVYLEEQRKAYLEAQPTWSNGEVWGLLDRYVTRLSITWEDVAFTNWSKCRAPSRHPLYGAHVLRYVRLEERLPLFLEPRMVVIVCGHAKGPRRWITPDLEIPIVRIVDNVFPHVSKSPPLPNDKTQSYILTDVAEYRQRWPMP